MLPLAVCTSLPDGMYVYTAQSGYLQIDILTFSSDNMMAVQPFKETHKQLP